MRRELSSLEYRPYTHARRNRLLFAKRQRGIYRLHSRPPVFFSPVPQGPGQDEWHSTTKSKMTASAGNRTWISRSRVSNLNHWTIPDSLSSILGELNSILWCYFSPYLWLRIMRQAAIFIKIPMTQTTAPTYISEKLCWLISSALLLLLMFELLTMSLEAGDNAFILRYKW